MIIRRLMIMAVFTALMATPILGQQYATDQVAGAQVSPNANIASALNVTPVSGMATGVNVNITNVSFLGDEWVTIANQGGAPVNLNSWVLTDDAQFRYVFPSQTLPAGSILRIHFGHGFDVGPDMYLGLSGDMLNDAGDVVTLYDGTGAMVSRYAYPGLVQAQQVLPTNGAVFPGVVDQPLGQVQRGVLVEPGEFSPASRGAQIQTNATSTYVTQLANVSAIFETSEAVNVNITNVGITGDEFIQVTNEGSVPVNLTGWMLTAGADFAYAFPLRVLSV
ncbi:MAG TPA: lamin tail domain-containing protein, partial [Methanotrichaceae archaeon]|nr:lamin tail domain-containing protein [Methanotrichaceae archaeon]